MGTEVPTEEEGVATGGVALKKQEVATSGVALPELTELKQARTGTVLSD